MSRTPSSIELNVFKGKTPEICGVKCFVKDSEKGEVFHFHRHDFLELEYIDSGSVKHTVCDTEIELSSGGFILLDTDDFHKVEVTEGGRIFTVSMLPRLISPMLQRLLSKFTLPTVGIVPEEKRGEMSHSLKRIRHLLFNEEVAQEEKVMSYILIILSTALEYSNPILKKKESGAYKHVTKATDYIQSHYSEDISLDDIARAVYVSANHLSKLFSEANGISVSQYLTEFRLEMARYAIISSDKSISDIAMECGFGSFSSFSRSWKRYYGISPREYKKTLSAEDR